MAQMDVHFCMYSCTRMHPASPSQVGSLSWVTASGATVIRWTGERHDGARDQTAVVPQAWSGLSCSSARPATSSTMPPDYDTYT